MTPEKYNELVDKYQSWIGKPVELFVYSTVLGKRVYKKFLLKDIKGFAFSEGGHEAITTSVLVQDLESFQEHPMTLTNFDQSQASRARAYACY